MTYVPIPMIPGPTSIHPDVLAAIAQDYRAEVGEEDFMPLYDIVGRNLSKLMGTKNEVVLMTGEGMLALWGALKSCLKAGDPVLCVGTGVFGDGVGDMAESFGCKVTRLSFPYDTTLTANNLARIDEAIQKTKPVMITATHCETPSGTLNPLAELGKLKKDRHVPLLYVDAVSSIGGAPVHADDWNIDLVLGGSQKCLSAPPSMSFVSVSEAAWARMAEVGYQGYDAIAPFKTAREKQLAPYTPNWHGIAALHAATQAILAEGIDNVFQRHENVAKQCRDGLKALGISLWPTPEAVNSPTVTAAKIPNGVSWAVWREQLRRHGLICGESFGPMAGKVFRLGHMGTQAKPWLMDQALDAIAVAMRELSL